MCESQNRDIVITKFVMLHGEVVKVYMIGKIISANLFLVFKIVGVRFGAIRLRAVKFCCLCIYT